MDDGWVLEGGSCCPRDEQLAAWCNQVWGGVWAVRRLCGRWLAARRGFMLRGATRCGEVWGEVWGILAMAGCCKYAGRPAAVASS